jgi:DNA-binding beta-propeller fold protein YncE
MAAAARAQPAPLQLEARIPLGKVAGRIDHMAFDLASRDLLYIANGGDGVVRVHRGSDFSPAAVIPLGSDADNVRFDPAANRIVVGHGKGALAIIDPAGGAKVADIPLKAHPESFQLDPDDDRIFVNLPEARSIAVVSKTSGQAVANWPQTHGGNYAMTLDNEKQRVFVAFRNPAKFAALAKYNGALVADVDTCGDADDLFFDAKRRRVYISCGQGFIDVLDARDSGFARMARVATVPGARTSLFVPDADRLYLAVRAQGGQGAAIWVYRPVD